MSGIGKLADDLAGGTPQSADEWRKVIEESPLPREAFEQLNAGSGANQPEFGTAGAIANNVGERFAASAGSVPARGAEAIGSGVSNTAKYSAGAVAAGVGIPTAGLLYNAQQGRQAEEEAREDINNQIEGIRNNPNLSPEQKAEAIENLTSALPGNQEADPGILGSLFPDNLFSTQTLFILAGLWVAGKAVSGVAAGGGGGGGN